MTIEIDFDRNEKQVADYLKALAPEKLQDLIEYLEDAIGDVFESEEIAEVYSVQLKLD
jgi:hypothetical protein